MVKIENTNNSSLQPIVYYNNNNNNNHVYDQTPKQSSSSSELVTQYIKVEKDGKTLVSKPEDLNQSVGAIGLVGPPGAAKSTISNGMAKLMYKIDTPIFPVGSSYETVTEGIWVMSKKSRQSTVDPVNKDIVDVEGHNNSQERSWKLAMLLCVICEEVVLCNRDARGIALIQAVDVFKMGMDQCAKFGMRSITKQMFVMVHELEGSDELLTILRRKIPGMEFIVFTIPEFTRQEVREMKQPVSYHPDMLAAIKSGVLDKIKPRQDTQALSSKAASIEQLLQAYNKGDFTLVDSISKKFFIADCKRMVDEERANAITRHMTAAEKKTTMPGSTFDQFMQGVSGRLQVDFTKSTFYIQGKSEVYIKEFFSSPSIDQKELNDIYNAQFQLKKAKEREAQAIKDQADQNKKTFLELVKTINANAEQALRTHVNGLKFNQTYAPHRSTFINDQSIKQLQQLVQMKPDYTPFYTYYDGLIPTIAQKWSSQIDRAKWKAPVQAHGDMTCKGGCKMTDRVVCSKDTCHGPLFWVDGPSFSFMCQKCELKYFNSNDRLICLRCNNPCNCVIRPNGTYIP